MSGHSKWHNIQAKKGKTDAARGAMFTKLGREIAVAAKGNPNPETNSKLADAIAKAKANNMPNDTIKRSIAKAAGELGDKEYKELTYEGYGVGGAAVIITTLTDNVNRTAGDVRSTMSKCGGEIDLYSGNDDQVVPLMSLGGIGCISTVSNVIPARFSAMTRMWADGDTAGAGREQVAIKPLIDCLFKEVNPIPLKAALNIMGMCSLEYRLPLCPPSNKTHYLVYDTLQEFGLA